MTIDVVQLPHVLPAVYQQLPESYPDLAEAEAALALIEMDIDHIKAQLSLHKEMAEVFNEELFGDADENDWVRRAYNAIHFKHVVKGV